MVDEREQVTVAERRLFRSYAQSLTLPQLVCLIEESTYERDRRNENLPQDRRGVLKSSARQRLNRDPLEDLSTFHPTDEPIAPSKQTSQIQESEEVDQDDPLGMGF